MIEFSFYTFALLSGVVAMIGFGVGLFAGMMLIKARADAVYEGKVSFVGSVQANVMKRKPQDAGNRYPRMVLNVTFNSKKDGWATLQVEDDSPLRRAFEDTSVRDQWRLVALRTARRKKFKRKEATVDWRDTEMSKAFGGQGFKNVGK